MTLEDFIHLLNGDLAREYQHMLFYANAANQLVGLERLYLADKLKEHAASEMQHVFQFAQKIKANGVVPVSGWQAAPLPKMGDEYLGTAKEIILKAIELEEDVVKNYHERHAQASKLHGKTDKHYDLVIFLEEQIEHSQGDIDELRLLAQGL